MRRTLTLAVVTLLALAGCGGYQAPSGEVPLRSGTGATDTPYPGTPDLTLSGSGSGSGTGSGTGTGSTGKDGGSPPDPAQQPSGEPSGSPPAPPTPAPAAGLERLLLLPVDLVAPPACFTEGLARRYVDGYGAQVVDPRPQGEIRAVRVEYDELTRLPMDSTERRVHLLPGSGQPVEVIADGWVVHIDVHMFLSGGFKIDYSRSHRSTGAFRQRFSSPVDPTCTVEIVYALTTTPVP